jgi:MFS family permease
MKISSIPIFYFILALFSFVSLKVSNAQVVMYFIVLTIVLATAAFDFYGKSHKWLIFILLIIVFCMSLPKMSLLFLLWVVPGFFISLLLFREIDLVDRIAFGFVISLCLLLFSVLLSYVGVPISRWLILLIFFAPFLALLIGHVRKDFIDLFSSGINHKLFSFIVISALFVLLVYSPFFKEASLPQTTAVEYYSSARYVERTLVEKHAFPVWEVKNTLGQARYTLDSPAYFWFSAVSAFILGRETLFIYNQAFIFLIVLAAVFLFLALKKISSNNFLSLLIVFLFFSSATIGAAVGASGNMKGFAAVCIGIIALYLLAILKEKRDIAYLFFLLLVSGIAVLFHPVALYLCFGIIISAFFCIEKKQFVNWRFWSALALLGLIFIFWIMPFVHYSYSVTENLGVNIGINFMEYLKNNLVFIGVSFLLMLIYVYLIISKKEKFHYFLVGFLPFCLLAIYSVNWAKLPVMNNLKYIEFHKTEIVLSFAFAFLLLLAIKNLISDKKLFKIIYSICLISILIFACFSSYNLHKKFSITISETIHSGGVLKEDFDYIKRLPPGNFFTFGVFGLAIDGIFYENTNHPTIGIGFSGAQETYLEYKIRYDDGYTIYPNSRDYITNLFLLNDVKYVFLNVCNPAVNQIIYNLFENTYLLNKTDSMYTEIYGSNNKCFVILELKGVQPAYKMGFNSSFVDNSGTECIRGSNNACIPVPKLEKEIYNKPEGNKYVWSYTKNPAYDLFFIKNDTEITYSRDSDTQITISGDMSKEWIYVAESYFPRWHAFDESGKELKIIKSNFATMIVQIDGETRFIKLKYYFPLWEKAVYLTSLVSIIGLFVMLGFYNNQRGN